MVLNLFLALLLNSFNCEELKSRKEVSEFINNATLYSVISPAVALVQRRAVKGELGGPIFKT
jgi:hypothetical protein